MPIYSKQPKAVSRMVLVPPSTNPDFHGSPLSAWFLMLAAALEFAAGCIHYFLPDGGAGVIAGLDLSQNGSAIIATFGWFGSVQIPFAALLFLIGLRYRTLIPLALLMLAVSRGLMSVDGWLLKGAMASRHPPEHFASPVVAILALIFMALALERRLPSKA